MWKLKAVEGLEAWRPDVDGPWDRAAAAHLVRRAAFGAPPALVEEVLALGPRASVRRLFEAREPSAGERVVAESALRVGSIEAAQGQWVWRMLFGASPAREKLALFWHDHFATSDRKVDAPRLMMRQIDLFRDLGSGEFEKLLLAVSRDPAMLRWLDGNSNRRGKPNENYARELMELFSLGIGNYGEHDIREAARAFTGWHERDGEFWMNVHAHDTGEKEVLGVTGDLDGGDIVRLCVRRPACARFLASKLHRFYVGHELPEALAAGLADLWTAVGGQTVEFLEHLLSSRAFYDRAARRALVASPVDFTVGAVATLEARANARQLAEAMAGMGQDLLRPPSVKGWDGGEAWLSSTTLLARYRLAAELVRGGGLQASVPWDAIEDGGEDALIGRLFPEGLDPAVESALKEAAEGDLRLLTAGCLQLPEAQYC